jgi:acyl transferase domain-containing protein/acyl-CoA synthetase (AMP-forming)/AMP-acid ligase II/acyl carrier protein
LNFLDRCAPPIAQGEPFISEITGRGGLAQSLDHETFLARVGLLAAELLSTVRPGTRALLVYPASVDFLVAFLACLRAGVIAIPVPALDAMRLKRSIPRLSAICADADAKIILTDDRQKALFDSQAGERVGRELGDIKIASTVGNVDLNGLHERARGNDAIWPKVMSSDTAYLQYTSGSTGNPKGVEITHGALIEHCVALRDAWSYDRESISVTWMPHFHDYGLVDGLLMPVFNGTPVYLMSPVSFLKRPELWLKTLSTYKGTHTQAPDFAYQYCVDRVKSEAIVGIDLSHVKVFSNGAEPVRRETLARFGERFSSYALRDDALFPAYGLAEATLLVSTKPLGQAMRSVNVCRAPFEERGVIEIASDGDVRNVVSCGPPIFETEVVIADPESGCNLGQGKVGEIWVHSPALASGYWNKPGSTKETFGGLLAGGDPSRRYLRTGDLGFLWDGELYPTGRIKDLLILDGRNIYPQDLEEQVSKEVAVVRSGYVAAFSSRFAEGEGLVMMAEVNQESDATDQVLQEIRTSIYEEFQITPRAVVLVGKGGIQKTSSGKLQRSRTCELWTENKLRILRQWIASSIEELDVSDDLQSPGTRSIETWIIEQIAQLIGRSAASIRRDEKFSDLGMDSRAASALVGYLEEKLEPANDLPVSIIWEFPTAAALADHIERLIDKSHAIGLADSSFSAADQKSVAHSDSEAIAVVGLNCRFADVDGPDELWDLLRSGRDAIRSIPEERKLLLDQLGISADEWGTDQSILRGGFMDRPDYFDPGFFGITAREAGAMDPQQRLVLESVRGAFERAGIDPSGYRGGAVGVFMGVATDDYGRRLFQHPESLEAYSSPGKAVSIVANRVSYCFDFRGPSLTIDTACSSSLVAVHEAMCALRRGDCDLAVVGGVNLMLDPVMSRALKAGGMLSESGTPHVFDASADGYVRGEGVGTLLLKRESDAAMAGDYIYARLLGSAVNQDGGSNGLTAPNPVAQVQVMNAALNMAGIKSSQVKYVEAHGTGTPLGDPIEVESIEKVYGDADHCQIGSVKSTVGHLEGAAGIAGLVKTILVVAHGWIPPQANLERINPRVSAVLGKLHVAREGRDFGVGGFAAVSSFGFGGTNAHIIVGPSANAEPINRDAQDSREGHTLVLPLSAHVDSSLSSLVRSYRDLLLKKPTEAFDICATAATGRHHLPVRSTVIAESVDKLVEQIDIQLSQRVTTPPPAGVCWLFSGQGTQFSGMGLGLQSFPAFNEALLRCARIIGEESGVDLMAMLDSPSDVMASTDVAQPALFSVGYALAQLYLDWGMRPAAVAGHSLGELTAACVAGCFTLEEMLPFVIKRARSMATVRSSGGMLAVQLSEKEAMRWIDPIAGLEIASVNGERSCVISGDSSSIDTLSREMLLGHIRHKRLDVSHAFHSAHMEPALDLIKRAASDLHPKTPHIPLVSNLTGEWIEANALTPQYWADHARRPVQFKKSVETLKTASSAFVEIGPGASLVTMAEQILELLEDAPAVQFAGGLQPERDSEQDIFRAAGIHFEHGDDVDWKKAFHRRWYRRAKLPDYPFQRHSFWPNFKAVQTRYSESSEFHLAQSMSVPAASLQVFWSEFANARTPLLLEHQVFGRSVVPGAGLIALLRALKSTAQSQQEVLALSDLMFLAPLSFDGDECRLVQLTVDRNTDSSERAFSISSVRVGADTEDPVIHVTGAQKHRRADIELAATSLEAIRKNFTDPPIENFYSSVWQKDIDLGPTFRWVNRVWRSQSEILVELTRPSDGAPDSFPGLLDSIFQGLLAGVRVEPGFALVPFAVDEFSIDLSGVERNLWAKLSVEPESENESGIKVDFEILTSSGKIVGQVSGFRARQVAYDQWTPKRAEGATPRLLRSVWSSMPPVSPASEEVTIERYVVIGPDEKLGSLLMKRLGAQSSKEPSKIFFSSVEEFLEKFNAKSVIPDLGGSVAEAGERTTQIVYVLNEIVSSTLSDNDVQRVMEVIADLESLSNGLEEGMAAQVMLVTYGALDDRDLLLKPTGPATAAAIGYARSARREAPDAGWKIVDINPAFTREQIAERLADAMRDGVVKEHEIIVREHEILSPHWEEIGTDGEVSRQTRPGDAHLISGGLGGIGLEVAAHLVETGAQNIWLIGRSRPSVQARVKISELERKGATIHVRQLSVEDEGALSRLLKEIDQNAHRIVGIFHCAGVLEDRAVGKSTRSTVEAVLKPKLLGAIRLDQFFSDHPVREFVLFSSVAAAIGNPGQTVYAAANLAMRAVMTARHQRGAPAQLIHWGPWKEVGMAAKLGVKTLDRLTNIGFPPLSTKDALKLLERATASDQTALVAAQWGDATASAAAGPREKRVSSSASAAVQTGLRQQLEQLAPTKRQAHLSDYLISEIVNALQGAGKEAAVDLRTPLFDLGLDSLGAVELRNRAANALGIKLRSTVLFDYPNVAALSEYLLDRLGLDEHSEAITPRPSSPARPLTGEMTSHRVDKEKPSDEEDIEMLLRRELEDNG